MCNTLVASPDYEKSRALFLRAAMSGHTSAQPPRLHADGRQGRRERHLRCEAPPRDSARQGVRASIAVVGKITRQHRKGTRAEEGVHVTQRDDAGRSECGDNA